MGNKIVFGLSAFMILVCAILLVIRPANGASSDDPPAPESPPQNGPVTPDNAPDEPEKTPSGPGVPDTPDDPDTPDSPDIPDDPTGSDKPAPESYEFGTFLEKSEAVEDSYFDSAVFLGDSRTEGLQMFGGIAHGDFYWSRGMSVFHADSEKYAIFDVDGEKLTMLGALRAKKYDSVYIMLGINELGYSSSSYSAGLSALLDAVIEAQPEAVIYLQTLPPINDSLAEENNLGEYERNRNVTKFNDVLVRLAAEKRVVLLDTASAYRAKDGQLPASLTRDGVHFTANGYKIWADFLRTHTMDRERYLYNRDGLEENKQ